MRACNLLRCYLLCLASAAGCTQLPQDIPGVGQQLPTTPKTPAHKPTVSSSDGRNADPAAEWFGPGADDPDLPGTMLTPPTVYEHAAGAAR